MGQKSGARPFFARIANRSNSYDTPPNSDGEHFYVIFVPKETCLYVRGEQKETCIIWYVPRERTWMDGCDERAAVPVFPGCDFTCYFETYVAELVWFYFRGRPPLHTSVESYVATFFITNSDWWFTSNKKKEGG